MEQKWDNKWKQRRKMQKKNEEIDKRRQDYLNEYEEGE